MTIDLLRPDWPAPASVRACTSTRAGGVSQGHWAGLNLAAHVGDDPAAVAENRRILRTVLELPAEPAWLQQVHGVRVCELPELSGDYRADAAFSSRPGQVCAVLTADCLPVLLCAEDGSAVAAVHAGWRGLEAGVLEAAVRPFAEPARVLAWLGPAIGPRAFEVGDEVRAMFIAHDPQAQSAFVANRPGHWLADLYLLARLRLRAAGVSRIFGGGLCTYSDAQRFYSFRREPLSGRMASLIWIES